MSRILQIEELLLRSRRLPWLVVAIVLVGLALAIYSTSRRVQEGIRSQMIQREAEVLHAVLVARLETLAEGELQEDPADPVSQLAVVLSISRLEGVLGIRLFDAEGRFVDSFPPTLREADVPAASLGELLALRSVGRFLPAATLTEEFYPDPRASGESSASVPLLEVYTPLHAGKDDRLLGAAQFLVEGSVVAAQLHRLDRHLLAQAALTFLISGSLLGLALAWAFRRLHGAHRQLAQRTESLLKANAELSLAARTTALGAITSHLVHGLKSPLAGLQNLVASGGQSDGAPAPEDWAQAAASMRRMQRLIQDVIQVLREHPEGQQYELRLGEVAELVAGRMAGLAESAGVNLEVACPAEGELDNRVANLVALILGNLTENAIQSTPRGKSVRLRIHATPAGVVCRVQDEGPGVAAESKPRLFQPMTSTKEGGSGLGLAIARQLAQHLEAELKLAENSEAGAVFELVLPAALVRGSGVPSECRTPETASGR